LRLLLTWRTDDLVKTSADLEEAYADLVKALLTWKRPLLM